MFDKILIANRGEIACRIIKTARRMGVRTVAVFSEADAGAPPCPSRRRGDLHRPGGGARSPISSAKKSSPRPSRPGAKAIHPGYGFLSENEGFCRACDEAGIVFIGPPVGAIRAMGSKSEAKKTDGRGWRAAHARLSRRRSGPRQVCCREPMPSAIPSSSRRRRAAAARACGWSRSARISWPIWPRANARRRRVSATPMC